MVYGAAGVAPRGGRGRSGRKVQTQSTVQHGWARQVPGLRRVVVVFGSIESVTDEGADGDPSNLEGIRLQIDPGRFVLRVGRLRLEHHVPFVDPVVVLECYFVLKPRDYDVIGMKVWRREALGDNNRPVYARRNSSR